MVTDILGGGVVPIYTYFMSTEKTTDEVYAAGVLPSYCFLKTLAAAIHRNTVDCATCTVNTTRLRGPVDWIWFSESQPTKPETQTQLYPLPTKKKYDPKSSYYILL